MYWNEYEITYQKTLASQRSPDKAHLKPNPELTELIELACQKYAFKSGPPTPTLELGCGIGHNTITLMQNCCWVTGIDISATAIRTAKNIFKGDPVDFFCMNICEMKYQSDFDFIFDSHALHCIVHDDERVKAFQSIFQALTPGGVFALECMVRNGRTQVDQNCFLDEQDIFWQLASDEYLEQAGCQDLEMLPTRRIKHAVELEKEILSHGFEIHYLMVLSQKKMIPNANREYAQPNDPELFRALCVKPGSG